MRNFIGIAAIIFGILAVVHLIHLLYLLGKIRRLRSEQKRVAEIVRQGDELAEEQGLRRKREDIES